MARHVIQIPINKSSNTAFANIAVDEDYNGDADIRLNAPAVSNKLYSILTPTAGVYGFGLAWDEDLMPIGKKIISVKLHFYTIKKHSRSIIYKFADFSEGSGIPSRHPGDGATSGGVPSGWGHLDLGIPKSNSVLIEASLQRYHPSSGYGWIYEYWELYSHRSPTNKPYIEVTYDDIPPEKPTSLYPNNETLNPRDIIKFSWLHNSEEKLQQKGFNLQYSINNGTTWTTVNQTTPNQFYDMPVNTLPTAGTVLWRVRTTDDNGEVSEYETASFTLGVVAQKEPIPISPISQYIDETKPIRFEWNFIGGSGNETQSKFDLEYSINGGTTWVTVTRTTEDTFLKLPANTFSGGNVIWRIRTYNNWNEVSPYSENKSFTVIGSPPIPQILDITNTSRPTIFWRSQGQQIYELQILKDNIDILDTGSIPSTTDKSYKLKEYLQDGNYKVRLKIINEYNLSSPWAERSFIISTAKPDKPIVTIYDGEYGVTIKANDTSLETLVYRDDIYIGKMVNNNFVDYTGENKKEYKYFIRAIDENDSFADSDIKLSGCKFGGNTLALTNAPEDFIKLRYGLNANADKSNQFGITASLQYYDGRRLPIVEYGEFESKSKTLTFYLRTKKELTRFIEMIKQRKTFLYRNVDGDNIYGSILNIDYNENETFWGYEISFTIAQTDYKGDSYD